MTEVDVSLMPLFQRARKEGLWFYSPYQALWFSPNELESLQANGRFRWGAPNWELRSPDDRLKQKQDAVQAAVREYEATVARVGAARRS